MARYIGPTCKLARREGADLGPEDRPLARSTPSASWSSKPGQHGRTSGASASCPTTALQLREKQKVKRMYGRAGEVSSATTYEEGRRPRRATPAKTCCSCWRSRLDNVVYRMGFALDPRRTLASWCRTVAITVNGTVRSTLPSYPVSRPATRSRCRRARHRSSSACSRMPLTVVVSRSAPRPPSWVEVYARQEVSAACLQGGAGDRARPFAGRHQRMR